MNGLNDPFSGGWVARFENEEKLLAAVKAMKKEEHCFGCSAWDVVAPWPCTATRLVTDERASRFSIKWMSMYGTCGAVLGGVILCLWILLTQTNPAELVVQGRVSGWSSWPNLVPPVFEGILLGAGLGIAIGFLRTARLPEWYHWVFDELQGKPLVSDGDFLIVASAACGERVREVLEELRPISLDVVEAGQERGMP